MVWQTEDVTRGHTAHALLAGSLVLLGVAGCSFDTSALFLVDGGPDALDAPVAPPDSRDAAVPPVEDGAGADAVPPEDATGADAVPPEDATGADAVPPEDATGADAPRDAGGDVAFDAGGQLTITGGDYDILGIDSGICSTNGSSISFGISNARAASVDLIWVDFGCGEHGYGTILPGGNHNQQTYVNHVWRVRNHQDSAFLAEFRLTSQASYVVTVH